MTCLNCRKGQFETRFNESVEQEFRDETFHVQGDIEECQHCGWRKVTDDQAEVLARRTVDAYRRKHGLLTEDDIRDCRGRFGMSQNAFAHFLGVSPVTVKRWETGQIQEPIYDQLIRKLCNLHTESGSAHQWLVKANGGILENGIVVLAPVRAMDAKAHVFPHNFGRFQLRRETQHAYEDSYLTIAA